MRTLEDGSTIAIRKNGAGFIVEHITAQGVPGDAIECDTISEARAAFHYGPSRW
jgi:hypothetical protein